MKRLMMLLCVGLVAGSIADEYGYFKGTNTITVAEGEALTVLGTIKEPIYHDSWFNVEIPPYDGTVYKIGFYESDDTADRTFPGPCKMTLYSEDSIVGYKIIKTYSGDNEGSPISGHLSSGINGNNYVLNFETTLNAQYQIQSSTTLTNWIDVGGTLTGTGYPMTWANSLTNSKSFYRVINK